MLDTKEYYKRVENMLVRQMREKQSWAQEAMYTVLFGMHQDCHCAFCNGGDNYSGEAMARAARSILTRILESEYEAGVSVTHLVATWSMEELAERIKTYPDATSILRNAEDEIDAEHYRNRKASADKFAAWQRGEVQY